MNPKKRGLGRGLDALFGDEEVAFTGSQDVQGPQTASEETRGKKRQFLGVDQLQPGRFQPRSLFDDETIQELSESIKAHGVLQSLLVRKIDDPERDDAYEIIAGERRWRASQKAGLHEVPVMIMELSDLEALEIALIENLQREDLGPVDEAMGYQKLIEDYGHTQEQLARSLGKSRSYVANMMRLLSLPDVVLAYLERGDLSIGHARALITAPNAQGLAHEIVKKGLSVRETEAFINAHKNAEKKPGEKSGFVKGPDTLALEKELSNQLGMRVHINTRNGQSGKLVVDFKDLDQLDVVLKRIGRL